MLIMMMRRSDSGGNAANFDYRDARCRFGIVPRIIIFVDVGDQISYIRRIPRFSSLPKSLSFLPHPLYFRSLLVRP